MNFINTKKKITKFEYEGSSFKIERTGAFVKVLYQIMPMKLYEVLGTFSTILVGDDFNKKLTKFIDSKIFSRYN